MSIHPSALIAEGARIPKSCTIGPYCTIGPEVELGEECTLISHVVIDGRTRIGARNIFYPFGSIGLAPQDLKYKGEPTETEIGDGNTIRECVTISRGTAGGGGVTRLGSSNLLMAYVHIGHDSQVGSHCILANNATLAGHVTIEDHVTLGAFCPVHQHCTLGAYSFIGGGTIVTQDVLPFSLTSSRRENKAFGINKIGLERRGFTPERLKSTAKGLPAAARRQAEHHAGRRKDARAPGRRRGPAGQLHRAQRARGDQVTMKLGLIAGNGRFPFLLLDAARAEGLEVVVAAIKEETDPEMDRRAEADSGVTVHWLSLGELSRLIETFQKAGSPKP